MPARALKWMAIAVGALLALLAVCGVLLRLLFDPNDYRTKIELAFNERTGRSLELEGSLSLALLPRLAVSTGRFTISDRPSAGTGDFLTAQDARIRLALLPLLQRRLEFGVLTIVEPALALRIDAQGRDNWSDLLEQPGSADSLDNAEPAAAPDESALDLRIAGLAIDDGRLTLEDDRDRRHWQVAAIELETGPLDFAEPTPLRAGFSLLEGNAVRLRALVNGRVAQPRPRVWTLHDLDAALELPADPGGHRQAVAGRIAIAHLTADLEARRYDAPGLRYRLGEARGEASLEARHTEQGLTVHGPLTLQRTDLRALLASLGIRLPPMRDPDAPGDIELSASLRYGPGLELRELASVIGDTRLSGSLALGEGSPKSVRFDLRGDRLDADAWMPAPAASTDATAAGPGTGVDANERLRARDVMGRLSFGRLTLAGIELSDFEGRVTLHDGVLEADPLQAALFGGKGSARLRYELASPDARLVLQPRLVDVDAAALLGQFTRQSRLSGRGSLHAELTGTGRDRKALLASLAGPFEARIVDGRVAGIDLWAEIERAVAAARGAAATRASGKGYTPFDLVDIHGRLAGRRIQADRFVVANASIRAQGAGTVDYGSGTLDFALTARLLEAPEGEVAGIPLDRIVGVDVPLTVGGTLVEPRVRPDVGRLVESAARQHLRQEGEQVEKKLKDKLNETLKDLFGQ